MTPAVLAAAAAFVFAADARADDPVPVPMEATEVEAVVAELEATLETAVETTVETVVTASPDAGIAVAEEPALAEVTETAPEAASAPAEDPQGAVAEAPVIAPLPDTEPEVATEPAAGPDTGQYHPADEPAPAAEPPATVDGGSAPAQWTWIWNWDCSDSVEMPTPSGTSWTWIWNWNCESTSPISGADSGQYQPQLDRYQDGNVSQLLPTNFNLSIRILSPGDDGAVTQLNSTVSTTTSLTTTILQTVHQTVDAQVAAALPAVGEWSASVPSQAALATSAAIGWLLPAVAAPGLLQAEIGGLLGDGAAAASDRRRGAPARAWRTSSVARHDAARGEPLIEAAAPAPRGARPGGPDRGDQRDPHPFQIVFPSPVASAGGAATGGAGGAFAAFLLALALVYLVVPPDIRRRVQLAEGRPPRGVDLGGDGRPG